MIGRATGARARPTLSHPVEPGGTGDATLRSRTAMPTMAGPQPATVTFYARTRDQHLIYLLDFYRQDVEALTQMGYRVEIATTLRAALLARTDASYCWWWHLSLPVVLRARLRRRPVVVTGACDFRILPRAALWSRASRVALTHLTARLASGNIAISTYESTDLAFLPERRLRVILPSTALPTEEAPTYRSARPSAVIVAQLNPGSIDRKGVALAIQAAALVRRAHPDFALHVVGPSTPAGRSHLEALLAGTRTDGVTFHGEVSVEHKEDLLASAWFYLQPSLYEGFGLAVAEAMARGAIPIVTAAGALPEVVADAGTIVERNPEAIATAVVDLLDHPDARLASSSRAAASARRFSRARKHEALSQALSCWGFPASGTGRDSGRPAAR